MNVSETVLISIIQVAIGLNLALAAFKTLSFALTKVIGEKNIRIYNEAVHSLRAVKGIVSGENYQRRENGDDSFHRKERTCDILYLRMKRVKKFSRDFECLESSYRCIYFVGVFSSLCILLFILYEPKEPEYMTWNFWSYLFYFSMFSIVFMLIGFIRRHLKQYSNVGLPFRYIVLFYIIILLGSLVLSQLLPVLDAVMPIVVPTLLIATFLPSLLTLSEIAYKRLNSWIQGTIISVLTFFIKFRHDSLFSTAIEGDPGRVSSLQNRWKMKGMIGLLVGASLLVVCLVLLAWFYSELESNGTNKLRYTILVIFGGGLFFGILTTIMVLWRVNLDFRRSASEFDSHHSLKKGYFTASDYDSLVE